MIKFTKSIVKNRFGFSILLFTASDVIDKFYRQVLTPVNNSQLLLKLEILDKFRLVTNHKGQLATLSGLH